ncbi:discoidin-1 subunit B/C-like [Pecten maximus]|uniref:discoidin-1 subunit B/C-like n=1 Tax=Pecten maximus TaxID=6579 RepID=UPI00145837EB|nr:discoidin-1 subunit B/C-like [Pecten maximus]
MEKVIQIFVLLTMAMVCAGCSSCDFDLVTGPYGVSDHALTASSFHSHCPVPGVRMSSSNGWCPLSIGNGHYLQVEFQAISALKAIQTRGRANANQWVTSYRVNTSKDGITWSSVLNSTGHIKVT